MNLNRSDWKTTLRKHGDAPWPCPSCGEEKLYIQEGTLHIEEGRESKSLRRHDEWEPSWTDRRFSCLLVCGECKESVAVAGKQTEEEIYFANGDGDAESDVVEELHPLFFHPPLNVIGMPDKLPEVVTAELVKSFEVFWCDAEACAGHIRSAIEKLLDWKKVKRFEINLKKRQRFRLSLHRRIDLLPTSEADVADCLRAVKWIGNAGAHSDEPTRDDVLDGYAILEEVFEMLFVGHRAKIKRIIKDINRKRRPRSAIRRLKRFGPK